MSDPDYNGPDDDELTQEEKDRIARDRQIADVGSAPWPPHDLAYDELGW